MTASESAGEKNRRIDEYVKRQVALAPRIPPETVDRINQILAEANRPDVTTRREAS